MLSLKASEYTKQELRATRMLIYKLWGADAMNEFNRNYVSSLIRERGGIGDVFMFADHADGTSTIITQKGEKN